MGRMKPAGFFALRTPLLPLREFTEWSDAGRDTETAMPERRAKLRAHLGRLVDNPAVREAIFVATPDLDETIDDWRRDPESDRGRRAERALVRYVARMCSRATPFGLFAGCTIGALEGAGGPGVELQPLAAYGRTTRLDMEYVAALVAALERLPEVRSLLTFTPNDSIYRAAGKVRYVEALLVDRARQHRLVAVDDSEYLAVTLRRAAAGATVEQLATPLVDGDITLADAVGFVAELVDSQLLVSNLQPAITGGDPLGCLADALRALGDSSGGRAELLAEVAIRLARIDRGRDGSRVPYREIASLLDSLPAPVSLPRLFQVDMVKPVARAGLTPAVVDELERAARLLHALVPASSESPLDRFRQRFQERYEGREVALEEALDEELGIGFDVSQAPAAEASPLLRDISFPSPPSDFKIPWTATSSLLTRKVAGALRAGASEVEVTLDQAQKAASPNRPPLPASLAVSGSIAAASGSALAEGDFRLLVQAVVGPSGARMLGRFCHADPQLEQAVRAHLAAEEATDPEALFAEIVHLPEGRIGNITMRPVLRGYEIPYLGRSAAATERQLPLSDLLVSVQGGQVVLRSRRLGRRVIPRMSSAHNYAVRSVGTYRFLCSLQAQGVHGQLAWDWGTLAAAPYLPRVTSGRLVLSRQRWRLAGQQLAALQADTEDGRYDALRRLAAEVGLPRHFVVSDSDNELLTDLENPLSVETFVNLVARRDEAVLHELFPAPDELWVEGPEGRFVSEVIVPFDSPAADPGTGARASVSAPAEVEPRSRFMPGSEWLYLKLYTGTSTADAVLRDMVGPLVREERERGAIDRWFFIRYGDPDWHLRLRLHGDALALTGVLLRAGVAAAPLLQDGRLAHVAVDTFEPELSRYGGAAAMPFVEQFFEADSDAVLAIVELLSGDEGMDARWRLTLRGADVLLNDLGLELQQKRALARRLRDSYRGEFHADARFNGQVGDRYRKESRGLRDMLLAVDDAHSPLAPGFDLLRWRSGLVRPAASRLREMAAAGELGLGLDDLGASLVHMHANRLLRSAHRAQELVLYDFLDRLYMSFMERK